MIFITGTYPPQKCGVGDYLYCIMTSEIGKEWSVFYDVDWKLSNLPRLIKKMKCVTDPIINLQYPTMGYGTHLSPHILCMYAKIFLGKKIYVTIHEYSQLGWKGKLALKPLFAISEKVIFTTEYEKNQAEKIAHIQNGCVIKINSNIPSSPQIKEIKDRSWDVGYFGYLRPQKGLEEFLATAKQVKEKNVNAKICILGSIQPEFENYSKDILRIAEQIGVSYLGENTPQQTAEMINDIKIMYLPFPDGLSERRGSFLASVVNGCVIVSKRGNFTTYEQQQSCVFASGDEAVFVITQLLDDGAKLAEYQKKTLLFSKKNVPGSWNEIAKKYKELIEQ